MNSEDDLLILTLPRKHIRCIFEAIDATENDIKARLSKYLEIVLGDSMLLNFSVTICASLDALIEMLEPLELSKLDELKVVLQLLHGLLQNIHLELYNRRIQ